MTLSDLSVRRPVFAAVVAILLCVVGVAAFMVIPVRELPNIDQPRVSVTTTYPGASAEVVEQRITEVLERQLAGIQGVDRMESSSRDGRSSINITFTLDRGLDEAANDVRDRVSRVLGALPQQADAPQIAKADADSQAVMYLSFASTTLNPLELADYADRYLVERIATVPGVGQVGLVGAKTYAMRIWLNADALAARKLTVADVESALNQQNIELPAGYLESKARDFTVRVARGYATAEQFAQLPIYGSAGREIVAAATGGGGSVNGVTAAPTGQYVTRLGDVARVEEAAADRRRSFRGDGKEQVGINITRQSQANDLEISKDIRKLIKQVQPSLPAGTRLWVRSDQSQFTKQAIQEVWITMGVSLALVALVNLVFLGSVRAAIIPTVVAPICILSTFIVLAALGFSLNLLTLLALVLAIGLVVDDAIVVTENIQRRVDGGEPAPVAAARGARQVFFAVVATTLVLLAVFAPLMFLPGYLGKLFVELAVAVAAAIAFSAFLALSLSPVLASKLLRPARGEGWMARTVSASMDRLRESYSASLDMMLGGGRRTVLAVSGVVVGVALAALGLFVVIHRDLIPQEDRSQMFIQIQAPEGSGYDYTRAQVLKVEPILEQARLHGPVQTYITGVPRFNQLQYNQGFAFVLMKDLSKRKISTQAFAAELNRKFATITGARIVAVPQGGIRGVGGGVEMIASGGDYAQLARWTAPIMAAARDNPGLTRIRSDYQPNAPRLTVDIDRERAAGLGVSAQDVGRALETMFGSRRVTTYLKDGQEYDVLLQTDLEHRRTEQDLNTLYVRSGSGGLVPLASVVKTRVVGDTPDRRRVDRLRVVNIDAELNPGYSIADAVAFFKAEAAKQPPGPVIQWGGQAKDLQDAGSAVAFAFGMALLIVFLVLAAQFESFIHPAVIMLTVPLAAAGGLFGLLMAGSSLNVYSQIGLIILIGIAAKNGILIVEFSNQLREQGRTIREAVVEASALRLRPIIMTSISAAVGALPLILWQGAGSASRQTIGVVIFSGAIFATLLTLFVVPVFYNLLARFTKSPEWTGKLIDAFEAREQAPPAAAPGFEPGRAAAE